MEIDQYFQIHIIFFTGQLRKKTKDLNHHKYDVERAEHGKK